ncbi:MAG: CCA tRNA nucleotidyltransferase [Planctomycetota bacterium]
MRETATQVARTLRAAGFEALFAGGCVRDRLLGRPVNDYDVATSATPDEVQAHFAKTVAVGAAFGVVLVVEDGVEVEVATFREDLGYADGRHPEAVRFTDAKEDARRRDFTVNGMFEDPETGEILDFVDGRADLARRCIRAIGDPRARFREDRLRMLRAVRFATVLDFTIDPDTRAAVDAEAEHIRDVSAERIRDELTKLLVSGRGGRGLGLLLDTGLLARVLPEAVAMHRCEHYTPFHPEGDVMTHTRMLLDDLREADPALAWAALLHDIAKPVTVHWTDRGRRSFARHAAVGAEMSVEILERLRFPRKFIEQVESLVAQHMTFPTVSDMRTARQRRFLLQEDFTRHLELHRMDCEACHRDLRIHQWAREERARLDAEPPPIQPFLSGGDLIAMGFRPGPLFREMLEALKDAQLTGDVADRAQADAFIRARYGAALAKENEA